MFFSELVFFVLVVAGAGGDSDHHHHGEHSSDECTYLVSYVWMRIDGKFEIRKLEDNNATQETCQDMCNRDMTCKSVLYQWEKVESTFTRYCRTYNTTIPELRRMKNKYVFGVNHKIWPVYIMYDKCCGEEHIKHAENKCTNLYVDKYEYMSPNQNFYPIYPVLHNHGHGEHGSENITVNLAKCKAFCNKDVNCRSVLFQVHEEGGHRRCRKFFKSVAEIKDKAPELLVKLSEDDKKNYTKYITYDRYCGPLSSSHRCTNRYKMPYDKIAPLYPKYWVGYMTKNATTDTVQTCKDFCTADENCWNVVDVVFKGQPMCSMFNITVQRLIAMGKHDEIKNYTNNADIGKYKSYDRYCVGCHKYDVKYATLCHPIGWRDESTCDDTPGCCSVELEMSDASFSTCLRPSF